MKKSMLCAGLLTIFGATNAAVQPSNKTTPPTTTAVTATTNQPPTSAPVATTDAIAPAATTDTTVPTANENAPTIQNTSVPPTTQGTTPTTTQGTSAPTTQGTTIPATPQGTTVPVTTQALPPAPPPVINCDYKIPAETTKIEDSLVSKWAGNAAEQAFDLDYKTIDDQLVRLKSCFTDQGWQSFNDALQKSGNLNAIKSEKLMVSSMVEGDPIISMIKENQWKVSLPLQVVYQNEKEKLNQPLTINLIVGRKISGDLGIMQMIAMPRQPAVSNSSTQPATAVTAPADKAVSN